MSRHVRIRCPICGMLTWQSRLDKDWEFEVLIQHIKGAGRGKGFKHTYYEPETQEGVWMIKKALADKLEEVARRLRDEASSERGVSVGKAIREGQWDKAVGISKIARGTDFDTIRASISGLTGRAVEFLVISGAGRIAVVQDEVEGGQAAYGYEEATDYGQDPEDDYTEASDYLVETEDSEVEEAGRSGFRFLRLSGPVQGGSNTKWGDDDEEATSKSGVE